MPRIAALDGTGLYVKEWGPSEGAPVVLMHGWPLSSDTWDDLALTLSEAGRRVVAYDRRGFGRSDQPPGGYDYDGFSDDLARVLAATKALEDVTLAGFSMGGGEVARYMSRHGGAGVSKAILIGSVVPGLLKTADRPEGVPKEVFEGMIAGIKADRPKFFAEFAKAFYGFGPKNPAVSEEILRWTFNLAMQAGLKGTVDCVKAFGETDFRPDLPAFKVPTLIIHGDDDQIVPIDVSARAAAKGIKGSKLVEIKGGPHGLLASHKAEVAKAVLDFLKS